jgi:hypothetical protein
MDPSLLEAELNNEPRQWILPEKLLVKELIFPLCVVLFVWKEIHEKIYDFKILGSFSQMLFHLLDHNSELGN